MLRRLIFFSSIALFIIFNGCAYYNTFYNAKKYYNEAREIPLRDNGRPAPNAIQKYNNAIKKCGIILTDYKDSKYADDALFMLAQSLYYKRTSYIQAIEQFNDLLTFYPESEFIPEAYIFIAMSHYEFNQKEEGYQKLQDFIINDDFREYHPQALNVLSEYYIRDQNYIQAQYYLQNIIDNFTDSDEYEKAFYKLGESFHEAENYKRSNEIFTAALSKKISKKIKLNSRYFISLNHLLLEEFYSAKSAVEKLLKDEYRLDQISKIQLLEARILASSDEIDEAISIFDNIIINNSRTKLSAEAAYYLAETYFRKVQDYEKAIEYYNMVKTEYSNSEFVEESLSRSVVASQIIQYNNPDNDIPAEELVAQHFKLAEYYIQVIVLPDSALAVYDNIIGQIDEFNLKLDSLNLMLDNYPEIEENEKVDSIDSTMVLIDDVSDSLSTGIDSLAVTDSLEVFSRNDIQNLIQATEGNITKYQNEFIPYSRFIKIWIYKNIYQDSLRTQTEYDILASESPDSKYTYAAGSLMKDDPVEFITYQEKIEFEQYEEALSYIGSDLDLALEKLAIIGSDPDHKHYFDAVYSLGHLNFFVLTDSTAAKEYFNIILRESSDTDMKLHIGKFYDGEFFKQVERLEYIMNQEKQKQESEEDLLEEEVISESDNLTQIEEKSVLAVTDSIKVDSLGVDKDVKAKILEKRDIILPPDIVLQEGDNIVVRIEVLPQGTTGKIIVLKNLPGYEERISEIVNRTVSEWRFQPALIAGKPVKADLVENIILKK